MNTRRATVCNTRKATDRNHKINEGGAETKKRKRKSIFTKKHERKGRRE